MVVDIYVAPHERAEAIDAYRDVLTEEQVLAIDGAPEEEWLKLLYDVGNECIQSITPVEAP